ncbi:MAG TPA: exonuclease subunit SbcD [Chlorobaculum sp.]|uniref:Nuclease SbcCD subunit D n=1 Tax=Chlorobaculum tepidum (strain ATCC 49652 / DSM 12025 / NBRC 103806 / TLS) TaxID=194439 RepID=Q8KDA6_CHLTE|nr:exonuclease SbcCD subunit D C-terminal domain-containing protein [Chlorobaculum tepidum]AAM72381.1 exonuclease SbcD [Chlorobaculum tepidum TLS]HBU23979.1 exonuclease subunit SbcD [Chlorobaculum sp.]
MPLRILHTSDWHLGRSLFGRSRLHEFEAFLDWLAGTVESRGIELLVVAGDIFDTTTPGNATQKLYYQFLNRIALTPGSPCRHVVITSGNHDSPTFLDAPKELLRAFDVHVLGATTGDPADEVRLLRDRQGSPEAIVCAVPFLRDRDIRTVEPGESLEDKIRKLSDGVSLHYAEVARIAAERRRSLGADIPVIAMGHLFTAGCVTVEEDGVREIYAGALSIVCSTAFPPVFDYVALGHMHVPQRVDKTEHMRYCGSPIPMGFGEAKQQKLVLQVDFEGREPTVTEIEVPCFQPLERLAGSLDELSAAIAALRSAGSNAWLEIDYRGDEAPATVQEAMEQAVAGSLLEIRRIRNNRPLQQALRHSAANETLQQLDPEAVFNRCLEAYGTDESLRPALVESYREVLRSIREEDVMAEKEGKS